VHCAKAPLRERPTDSKNAATATDALRALALSDEPFLSTGASRLLFLSEGHRECLAALEWGVAHEPSGFSLVVGETGTGKTTLVSSILARKRERIRLVCVSNPKLGFDGILHGLMLALGIQSPPMKLAMLDAFDSFLADLGDIERVVLIVDEAQSLDDEALEELRLFSNRGRADQRQLGFVLVGQPQLLRRLTRPKLRQLNDRVGARAVLNPLTREEALDYVEYQMNLCGSSAARVFASDALGYSIEHSDGIPRRINTLCRNAMLIAYSARLGQVDLRSARAAVAEYDELLTRARRFDRAIPWARFLCVGGLLAGAIAIGFFGMNMKVWASRVEREKAIAAQMMLPHLETTATLELSTQLAPASPSAAQTSASEKTQTATQTRHAATRHMHFRRRRLQSHRSNLIARTGRFSIWKMLVRDWFKHVLG
jgi:general secretion pathway protein A